MKKLFGNKIFILILTLTIATGVMAGVISATKTKSTLLEMLQWSQ